MKRSEIIKVIYDTMRDNHFGQYGEFYKMAESVLDRLEDEGMLPPAVYSELFGFDPEYKWEEE